MASILAIGCVLIMFAFGMFKVGYHSGLKAKK